MTNGNGTNAASAPPKGWTVRDWIHAVIATMILQVAIVLVVARRPVAVPPRPAFATAIRLVTDAEWKKMGDLLAVSDPALFALPNLHGYSGASWLRYPLMQNTTLERTESPRWLELDRSKLARDFVQYVSSNQLPSVLMVDAPVPSTGPFTPAFRSDAVAQASRFQIVGVLASRTLLNPPELPSWSHTEILSNTVIRAVVDDAGWNFSATLVTRSGLPAADEYAIRLVQSARFRPLPKSKDTSGEFAWGNFIFLWHTRPVLATNAPPTIP